MRSGSSLTDRVCLDATSAEPEGNWQYAQNSRTPQMLPIILNSDAIYSLNPDGGRPAHDCGHHELAALQKQASAMRENRASTPAAVRNDSVRFQSFASAE